MSKYESSWQYTEQYPNETDIQVKARRLSLELGIEPVSRAIAASFSALPVLSRAQHILEVGTGVGVSALALLRHMPDAHLTSLDTESEHHRHAKQLLQDAGIAQARFRLVLGDAKQVLPRFNHNSYDLVVLDGPKEDLLDYVEYSLPLVREGGSVIIPHALLGGRVADPASRDLVTTSMRDLLSTVQDSNVFVPALSPVGDGLLTLTRLPESQVAST